MLLKTILNIFKCTRYGVWTLALIGIPCAIILMICNFSNGFASTLLCFAALLFSFAIVLFLLPKVCIKTEIIKSKRIYMGIGLTMLSLMIVGTAFFATGKFPTLNLIFI